MPLTLLIAALLLQSDAPDKIVVVGRPWAPFISPMGEPFRAKSHSDDTMARWFHQADRDEDGALSAAELDEDAMRFFRILDSDQDGAILPQELTRYEWEIAPEIQVNSRWRPERGEPLAKWYKGRTRDDGYKPNGLQGAARYALLNIPQPVAAADTNFDRVITLQEFRQAAAYRFGLLDRRAAFRLTLIDLRELLPDKEARRRYKVKQNEPDPRIGNRVPL